MQYDQESRESRRALAASLLEKLQECGFAERDDVSRRVSERVFARRVNDQVQVQVYTSIVGNEVRVKDADAIRVTAIYSNEDTTRGIVKSRRVYRTGEIDDITSRMYQRIRDTWGAVGSVPRCHCGAPKFTSKKGNTVCADLCWQR